ncbi:MAG TPA: TetR/AcrR family transcriptional regulator [Burkholderiaceae bacterium]|jgi:AcrR family transcriptional regulator|nr:TetR/AcrR family transcriptional regulator [Burkholderiaceae bacterium]
MTTTDATPERRPYHHGDLRHALIETALQVLAEEQQWDFTLRDLARRAGVSHAAPYKHFADKHALLSEVAARGFVLLQRKTEAAVMQNAPNPAAQLRAAGAAYVLFAVENPALFRLMFGPSLTGPRRSETLKEAATSARQVMVSAVERCRKAGLLGDGDPQAQALAAHSLVHGLAMLLIDQGVAAGTDPERTATAVLGAFFSRMGDGTDRAQPDSSRAAPPDP